MDRISSNFICAFILTSFRFGLLPVRLELVNIIFLWPLINVDWNFYAHLAFFTE